MKNVTIMDNGAAYMVMVDGMIVHASSSLGDAWRHIKWMYEIACQKFTVGQNGTPVKAWIDGMKQADMF